MGDSQASATGKASDPDWGAIYYQLKLFFPCEQQFDHDHFAKCPLILIEKALDVIYKHQLQQFNYQSVAIANLGCLLLQTQGVKHPETNWINPFPRLIEKNHAQANFDPEVAQIFIELAKTGNVPRWVFQEFPSEINLIKSCLD